MGNFGFMPGGDSKVGERFNRNRAMRPNLSGGATLRNPDPGFTGGGGLSRNTGGGVPRLRWGDPGDPGGEFARGRWGDPGDPGGEGGQAPGGGMGGFMPTPLGQQGLPFNQPPISGVGLDAEAVGASFDDLPELKEDVIQKAMEDPKNRNEDGSFKWHIILGSLAAGVAAAVTGGGLSGALQAGVATAGGGFKGLLAAEETKAKQAKLQAATNKMLTDRKLTHYKAMYERQVEVGDYLGAAKTLKISNRLTGSPIPEIDVDEWAEGRQMQDDMKDADGIIEAWTDQAVFLMENGEADPTAAWKDAGQMTDALIYATNPGLKPGDKILKRHERHTANLIGGKASKKIKKAKEQFDDYMFKTRGQVHNTMQTMRNRLEQGAGDQYMNDESGGPNAFTENSWNAAQNNNDQMDEIREKQRNVPDWNQDLYEQKVADRLEVMINSGEVMESVAAIIRVQPGFSEERAIADLLSTYSPRLQAEGQRMLKQHKKSLREKAAGVKADQRSVTTDPTKAVFTGKHLRAREAMESVVTGLTPAMRKAGKKAEDASRVVEDGIKRIISLDIKEKLEMEDPQTGEFRPITPEEFIDRLSKDPVHSDLLSDPDAYKMAIEAFKGPNGENLITSIRENAIMVKKGEFSQYAPPEIGGTVDPKTGKVAGGIRYELDKMAQEEAAEIISGIEGPAEKRRPHRPGTGPGPWGLPSGEQVAREKQIQDAIKRAGEGAVPYAHGPDSRVAQHIRKLSGNETYSDIISQKYPLEGDPLSADPAERELAERRRLGLPRDVSKLTEKPVAEARPKMSDKAAQTLRGLGVSEADIAAFDDEIVWAGGDPSKKGQTILETLEEQGLARTPQAEQLPDSIEPGSLGGQTFSDASFRFGSISTPGLDMDAVAIVNAIEQNETRREGPQHGISGEMFSRLQYLPNTWKGWAKEHIGDENAELTAENERKVAYLQVKKWLGQGKSPVEIASLWNSGNADPHAKGDAGVSTEAFFKKHGYRYHVPNYVASFSDSLSTIAPNISAIDRRNT